MARHDRHDDLAQASLRRRTGHATTTSIAGDHAPIASLGSVRTNDPLNAMGLSAGRDPEPRQRTVAMVLRLQQTHGNQAVQRLLHVGGTPTVQRDDDELVPSLTVGDYKVGPPKPTLETDDSQDTHDGRTRANQQNEDERGESPKPEWWKEKPRGKSTDPKDWADLEKWRGKPKPSGEDRDFGPIPAAEEPQPGDYPVPAPIEPEDGAYA